jgi:hypothetical protein
MTDKEEPNYTDINKMSFQQKAVNIMFNHIFYNMFDEEDEEYDEKYKEFEINSNLATVCITNLVIELLEKLRGKN